MNDVELDLVRSELRALTRRVVTEQVPTTATRALADDPQGFDEATWRTFSELGLTGLEISEEHGGAGMTFREVAVVLDELGRGVVPLPMLASVVLGTGAILAAGSEAQQREWLPSLAAGDRRLAVAIPPDSALVHLDGAALDGVAHNVVDAQAADALIVAAGDGLFLVPVSAPGVTVTPVPTYDQTRRLSAVRFETVSAELLVRGHRASTLIDWLIDRAATALACDSHGGARRVMEISVAYAKERTQFGRPIGSFQAVKHMCADMLIAVETAQVAAYAAARGLSPRPSDPNRWAAIAKSHATDAYATVTDLGIRVHGGIGYTWEHDMHLYVKRAKLNQALFGTPAFHRERYARVLLDGEPSTVGRGESLQQDH